MSVTQSGIGSVLFKLSDIYTATLGKDGKLIEGLAGATIQLQNEQVLSIDQTLTTDVAGEALFKDLPAGNYKYRASAPNHQPVIGRLKIQPGVTVTQPVFLDYTLVTIEWSVTEIPLEDRYEIVLKATYETDVPAPVVLLEPMSVNLPNMRPGEVFYGELSLTNYGLVRADDVKLTLPSTDQYFAYEFQANVPKSLEAKQRITIPYRITSLRSIDQGSEGDISGGGSRGSSCFDYQQVARVEYCFKCASGLITCASRTANWYALRGSSCGGSSISAISGSGGGGGGGGLVARPISSTLQCDPCDPPDCDDKNNCTVDWCDPINGCQHDDGSKFNEFPWNLPKTRQKNNCYNYAFGIKSTTKPHNPGGSLDPHFDGCGPVEKGVKKDFDLDPIDCNSSCAEGCHKVYLVVTDKNGYCYLYRRGSNLSYRLPFL